MKFFVTSLFLTVIIFLSDFHQVNAGRSDYSRLRSTETFTAISVYSGITLQISQGTSNKVLVEGNPDDVENIVTEVKNGTLHIYRKNCALFNIGFLKRCTVHVTIKNLEALDASSGTEVNGNNSFGGTEFILYCSSGSKINMDLHYRKIKADVSSGSKLCLKGAAEFFEVSVSSGSELDAIRLTARKIYAEVSSGGEVSIWATDELKANASSGGDIEYKGNPRLLEINKSSGGKIRSNTLSKNNYFCPSNWKVPDYRDFFLLS